MLATFLPLQHSTIESFNSMLTAYLDEGDALHVLCSSAEFDQLKMRPEELEVGGFVSGWLSLCVFVCVLVCGGGANFE